MKSFDVMLKYTVIDTVLFNKDMTVDEVRKSLIEHDGYDPEIVVTVRLNT